MSMSRHITDLTTGASEKLQLPPEAGSLYEAALSTDGRYLAITGVNNSFTAMVVGVFDRQTTTFTFLPAFRVTRSGAVTVIWNHDIVTFVAHDSGTAVLWQPGWVAYTVSV